MATSANIAIKTKDGFQHVRVNFDAKPSRMLRALKNHSDAKILAAVEIRFMDEDEIESYGSNSKGPRFEREITDFVDVLYTYYRNSKGAWNYREAN